MMATEQRKDSWDTINNKNNDKPKKKFLIDKRQGASSSSEREKGKPSRRQQPHPKFALFTSRQQH